MKVSTRIILGFAVLVILAVAPLIYQVSLIHQMQAVNHNLSRFDFVAASIVLEMAPLVREIEEYSEKYFVSDAIYGQLIDEAAKEFSERLTVLQSTVPPGKERVEVERLTSSWAHYLEAHAAAMKQFHAGETGFLPIPLGDAISQLQGQTETTYEAIRIRTLEEVKASAAMGERAARISWVTSGLALVLAVIVAALIVSAIGKPLERLTRMTRLIAKGQFWHRIPVHGRDEFSELARDFNAMCERLGELDSMKKDFVSHVSHDLKAPLASIRQVIHLMLQEIPGPLQEQQRRLLRLSYNSAERLSAMVGNLLDISRMEAGTMEYQIDKHDLAGIVRSVAEEFEVQANEREIRLRIESEPETVVVECDRDRMVQVVGNLYENALKFAPSNSEICARIYLEGDRALLSVADSGPGVPDEHKDRIFAKFHQVKQGRKLNGQGVGLGLAICKTIVEAHQGSIWVDDNPGGGSIFRVRLNATAETKVLEFT